MNAKPTMIVEKQQRIFQINQLKLLLEHYMLKIW